MTQKDKAEAVKVFINDPSVRIMLISLKYVQRSAVQYSIVQLFSLPITSHLISSHLFSSYLVLSCLISFSHLFSSTFLSSYLIHCQGGWCWTELDQRLRCYSVGPLVEPEYRRPSHRQVRTVLDST